MADFVLSCIDHPRPSENQIEPVDHSHIRISEKCTCTIFGKEGTYNIVRDGEDIIISLGYVCWEDGDSVQETLSQLLRSFHESQIADLKKRLIGEYVLLVKKGARIYVFSDFMGVRNIFYSHDGKMVSSSFRRAEDLVQTQSSDLDSYKLLEFIAMRHVLYPAWLGHSTYNKRINWLLPYEYLVFDSGETGFQPGSVVYSIDNRKQADCSGLSNELITVLSRIVARKEFKQFKVAASLTGGHDTRLIATIASKEFPEIHFRTSVSSHSPNSQKDLNVARKIAKIAPAPLDIFWFQPGRDEERFRELTESLSPVYNQTITPLLDAAGDYALGFGGSFGTELFMELPWNSIDDYIQAKVAIAKRTLKVDEAFWRVFCESLDEEFRRTKEHFQLSNGDDRDYIRLFGLIVTARYGSFIMSAYNRSGYQLDPYGNYAVLELALRVASSLWGNHKRLGGTGTVQKFAMRKLNPHIGKVLTYMHSRPMLPLTVATFPKYLGGFALQIASVIKRKFVTSVRKQRSASLPGGHYVSNGWETPYLLRTAERYGLPLVPAENPDESNRL